jgi:hypothetical protein
MRRRKHTKTTWRPAKTALKSAEAVESRTLRDGRPDGKRKQEAVSVVRKHRNLRREPNKSFVIAR